VRDVDTLPDQDVQERGTKVSNFYDDDQTEDELIENFQELINSGTAWKLEGSVGRQAMALIRDGKCMLGEEGHIDDWGNYVPARHEVKVGTKGSPEFVEAQSNG